VLTERREMMWGPWGWSMGVGSLLFLALIVIGVVLLVRSPASGEARHEDSGAFRILDARFARGEIDEEEYRRRRSSLEGSRS
jgi:putative membrane protein